MDDPMIRSAERTGYADWIRNEIPRCPVCGAECDKVYKLDDDIVGCDVCIKESWAEDEAACFPWRYE